MILRLDWYAVQVAIIGARSDQGPELAVDLQQELQTWEGWQNPQVQWDDAAQHVLVSIEAQFFDAEQAGATVQEFALETTPAYLADFDVLQVDVLDVRRLPNASSAGGTSGIDVSV